MPPAHQAGKVNGASAYYPDTTVSYPSQAEQELEMALEYDAQSLDELERRFLEETIALTKDQNKEEDKENARHREVNCSVHYILALFSLLSCKISDAVFVHFKPRNENGALITLIYHTFFRGSERYRSNFSTR